MSRRLALALATTVLLASTVVAEEASPVAALARDVSQLEGRVGERLDGRIALNIAAGRGNAQANLAAISHGAGSDTEASVSQNVGLVVSGDGRDALAGIGGSVLAAGQGLTSVNQAAGTGNSQLNLLAIGAGGAAAAHGVQTIDLELLATVSADAAPVDIDALADGPAPLREARIGDGAFQSPQGVLQINQTAGVGNASANAIVLQIPGGAP